VSTTGPVPVITFLGAARTVTGSRFLVDGPRGRVLVDCGLFQGPRELRDRNWAALPVPASSIDAVVLTHAHVDHCGYLPRLVADGFAGPVVCTPTTAELAGIVLPDAGHLQEEEAEFANRAGYSKHHPALPLFTEAQAVASLRRLAPVAFAEPVDLGGDMTVVLRPAGHILGSAVATLHVDGVTVVFSGDLGRGDHPLLVDPSPVGDADVVVVESTYGDRSHDHPDGRAVLADAIARTVERGGTVVIPAFAVDRTEVLLHHLAELRDAGRLPEVPIFVDSPMALAALDVYRDALERGDPDIRPGRAGSRWSLTPSGVHEAHTVDDSKRVTARSDPAIVIAASGMATGGRVLHHLERRLPDPRSLVLLVGWQGEGTRGRRLADGATEVKLLGRYVPVRAEILELPAFSVHADRDGLLDWVATAREPDQVLVVHGEASAASALVAGITERTGWPAAAPVQGERVRLDRRVVGAAPSPR